MRMEGEMLARLVSYLRLAGTYMRLNLRAQLEYRGAFVSQVVAMFLNDSVWVSFWVLFFTRFPVLRGWDVRDVITVWSIAAAGFGLANTTFGNGQMLARVIAQGQLDAWMLYPRALLPHVLLGRMSATAWGDTIFGVVVYVGFVWPDVVHMVLFLLLVCSVAVLFVGFGTLSGSLSFFLGNAVGVSEQWHFAMMTFSTYPAFLFDGGVKVVLFTLIPAVFINYFPVRALRELSLFHAGVAFVGALGVLGVGVLVFLVGLRRYESGNLMEMRG